MKIYLVLTDTQTLLSKTIKFYTKAEYNHASISLDSSLIDMYSFGRKRPNNPLVAGFIHEDLSREYFIHSQYNILTSDITSDQFILLTNLTHYYEQTQSIYHYNLIGLVTLALHIDFKRDDTFFCSQFVATILSESGVHDFQKEHHFITLQDLEVLPIFESIYTGSLYHYLSSSPNQVLEPTLLALSKA